jgi:transposase
MAKKEKLPKTNATEIEGLIERLKGSQLKPGDAELIERLLRTVVMLLDVLERKNLSIKKLRSMIFGPRTERRETRELADGEKSEESEDQNESQAKQTEKESGRSAERSEASETGEKAARSGHGRRAASGYNGAKVVRCWHENLKAGDRCPDPECQGRLYDRKEPRQLLQFVGRPMIESTKYEREVLRCAICLEQHVAPLPKGVADERYDATCDATIAVLKYEAAFPWYRQARMLEGRGIPLSESVLWERCEAVADASLPVFLLLERLCSDGEVYYADDTGVTILEWEKEKKYLSGDERKGSYTSGIVVEIGERKISLYASGNKHAGENVDGLLAKRSEGLAVPIQMSDGLSANWKGEAERIQAKCLVHARRKFYAIKDYFPEQCQVALDAIGKIYRTEAETKGMSPEERLAHHQRQSEPVMKGLKEWIERQFAEREAEPNSALGEAMKYFLRHYQGLTTFLRVSGAPLDNNTAERALKRFVLFRKNSLFFKNDHGAAVGNIIMSLIESCRINGVDPWGYLVSIRRNAAAVRKNPEMFLPWSYAKSAARERAA